jgi:hypothetical protein
VYFPTNSRYLVYNNIEVVWYFPGVLPHGQRHEGSALAGAPPDPSPPIRPGSPIAIGSAIVRGEGG